MRVVYSPSDAVKIAAQNPNKQVVFFAVGFETTAPANAMSVYQARQQGLNNYSVLVSHVLVPPAMEAILGSPNNHVQGFLGGGTRVRCDGVQRVRTDSEEVQSAHRGDGF